MQFAYLVLTLFAGQSIPAWSTNADTQSVAAVEKVIQMLNDMMTTAKTEKADEEVAFAKFETWCKEESSNLKGNIKQAGEDIESLAAEITKLQSETKELGKAIAVLNEKVANSEADAKEATAKREKDHAAFLTEEQDYSESVDAVERALEVIQKQSHDRPGAAALLQLVGSNRLSAKAQSVISTFASMLENKGDDDGMSYEAPEANAYEFQSGGLVEMLKKLQDDFRAQLSQCQKEEMNSKHAYDMVIQDLTDFIANSNRDAEEKSSEKERKTEKAALDKKERAATTTTKAEDEKMLTSMTAECKEKSMSFDEKNQLRDDEIEAIGKAIEILQSPDAMGNAEKHLDLMQSTLKKTALVQQHNGETASARNSAIRLRIRDFLNSEGQRLRSKNLALLAEKLEANPFAKVKKLIDDMITRLLEEANEDAKHEGFCDEEMGKSKVTRTKLSEDIDALDAAIEDGKATIMTLGEDIATLTKEINELDKAMGEATELRKAEKAKNAVVVKDAKAAQAAVSAATAVLKDFYEKAATATGFVQGGKPKLGLVATRGIKMGTDRWNSLANPNFEGTVDKNHQEGMQTFGKTYKGQQDEAGGVMAMLEVILSDFANLQSDTEAAETASQAAFEDFMTESKKSKAVKGRSIEMNTADRAAAESKLQQDIADLKSTQDELIAADKYYERLVPQCIDQGMTWEEMNAARQAEITSLKEALKILGSDDIQTSA